MKNALNNIDQRLSDMFSDFDSLAHQLKFKPICELSDQSKIAQQTYPGLYKIDIQTDSRYSTFSEWLSWFEEEWMHPNYKRKFTPNVKKKRVIQHSRLRKWIPIYLGRSKEVSGRVLQHINLGLDKPTTALKIASRSNMRNEAFRLSTIKVSVQNYDIIMPKLESALRNQHNPILGRQ